MRDRLTDLGDNTAVVLITFTDPTSLAAYSRTNDIPFPILVDPDRKAYAAYGLGRGSFARIWGWQAALRYLEIFRTQGLKGLQRPTEDTLQLGGDFIIGPDGSLVYGFWGAGPDDRPSVDDLIDTLQTIRS